MTAADPELLTTAADGTIRCAWASGDHENALNYHDLEWGVESHDPLYIFESIVLGGFAAGIKWVNVYRKREAFRRAFRGYELPAVAALTPGDVDELMQDAAIIRNRRKIEAAIGNARAALELPQPLHELVWEYAPAHHRSPRSTADFRVTSPEATALAKRLRSAGFAWVGPNSVYAVMQTVGIVNDHVAGCFLAADR